MNIKVFNRNKKSILLILFLFFLKFAYAQQVNVTGQIIDKDNNPIQGVSVYVQGQTKGVTSDINGKYSINAIVGDVLNFSFIGMKNETYIVKSSQTGNLLVNVLLNPDEDIIGEVVVVGYGSQIKENLATSSTTIESEIIENRGVTSVGEALQGAAPGLNIGIPVSSGNGGGAPGTGVSLQIRGRTSIQGGSPLVLVDGLERDINTLDPNDIKSVTVLEDIASAAIYGARAAFGVILIETKKGGTGDPVVNYSLSVMPYTLRNIPQKPNSYTFMKAYKEVWDNGGQTHRWYPTQKILDSIKANLNTKTSKESWDGDGNGEYSRDELYANTDAFKEVLDDIAFISRHNLSVSGALKFGDKLDKSLSYSARGSYMDQNGLIKKGGEAYRIKTFGLNLSVNTVKWLTSKIQANYVVRNNVSPFTGEYALGDYAGGSYGILFHQLARSWPNIPVSDWLGRPIDFGYQNFTQLSQTLRNRDNFYGIASFILTPIKEWKTFINYRYNQNSADRERYVNSIYRYNYKGDKILSNSAHAGTYDKFLDASTYESPQIYSQYELNLTDIGHYLKVLIGFEQEKRRFDQLYISRKGIVSDDVPSHRTGTGDESISESKTHWSTRSIFGGVNYTFGERYVLNANFRRDGSSRFSKGKKWGNFYSYALGYNMHNEPILKDFFQGINVDRFKLKFSSGEVGNQNIDLYQYAETLNIRSKLGWIQNDKQDIYTSSASFVNKDITWETVSDNNFGFEMRLLDKRLTTSFTYYIKTTRDMLGPVAPLPSTLGGDVPQANNAEMETKGFTINVKWQDKIGDAFAYDINLNFWDDESVITKYYNPTGVLSNWYVGRKFGEIWGYETIGIMDNETAEKVNESSQDDKPATNGYANQRYIDANWSEGDIRYKDLNGDGKIDNGESTIEKPGDRKIIGNSRARYNFSLDNNFYWKGIGIRLYFQGVAKRDVNLSGSNMGFSGVWDYVFKDHLDYWRPENKGAYYPKPYFNTSKNRKTQSRYLKDGSYVRLKNISISYQFDKSLLSSIGLSSAKVFISGDNIITFSNMPSFVDPELTSGFWGGAGKVYPLIRTYSLGFNVSI